MAPIPKPPNLRQRRNRTTTAATLEAPPATKVPLPGTPADWHPQALRWWDEIWGSPMVSEWVQADVQGLLVLAVVVDGFWRDPTPELAKAVWAGQKLYGLDALSRRQLQWEIKRLGATPMPKAPPTRRRSRKAVLSVLQGRGA